MTDAQIYEKLTPIFQDVFDDDDLVPVPELAAKDVDTWDSLSHIRLILAIESNFKIKFSSAEVSSFKNVNDLVHTVRHKLNA
jgi:acyl carrier protein